MSQTLVAPRYEPAKTFKQPTPAPFEFGLDSLTLEELMSTPATWAIVRKHAPWAEAMLSNEGFKPFVSVMTLRDVAPFIPGDVSMSVAAIDAELRALPRSDWPSNVR
jgi:hypothetical protein